MCLCDTYIYVLYILYLISYDNPKISIMIEERNRQTDETETDRQTDRQRDVDIIVYRHAYRHIYLRTHCRTL